MYATKEQFRAFLAGGYARLMSFQRYLALGGVLPAVDRRAGPRP